MFTRHQRTRTLAIYASMAIALSPGAHAQVAPTPATAATSTAPTFKAGWVAQVVSYKANVLGEVPLTSFILGAAQDDAYAQLGRLGITGNEAGLMLHGLINAPEAGRYGFLLTFASPTPSSFCVYTLLVDGTKLFSGRGSVSEPLTGEKALDLTAGRHSAELRIGCSNGLAKIRFSLKAKLPSADEVAPLGTDFIVHATRRTGD